MKIRTLVNAGLCVETPDLRCVIDPWLFDPIHMGAWWMHPRTGDDTGLAETVGPVDLCLLTHGHEDHAHPRSIKWLLERNPNCQVIGPDCYDVLGKIMKREGIPYQRYPRFYPHTIGETEIRIIPAAQFATDIDSVIVIRWRNQVIVHWSDVGYYPDLIQRVKEWAGDITVALIPYAGASDYPQQYYDVGNELRLAALNKSALGLTTYRHIRDALNPKIAIPFSSGYVIGGKNWRLNEWRGNADATDVLAFDKSAVVLRPGVGMFDLDAMQASGTRDYPDSDVESLMMHAGQLSDREYDYEREEMPDPLTLPPLLTKAYERAIARSEVEQDHWFYIDMGEKMWLRCNANRHALDLTFTTFIDPVRGAACHQLTMDPRLLHGLLTGRWHWNNCFGASLIKVRRHPDIYRREVLGFMDHFHV